MVDPVVLRHVVPIVIEVSLTNCCANFFIYAWTNTEFRKAYKKVMCVQCTK